MKLEDHLSQLQSVKAPDVLKHRLQNMVRDLPAKRTGLYFPLFAFQGAVIAAALVLLIGLGAGVVTAAKGSRPGNPLYPVRQAIEKIPVPFVHSSVTPTLIPVRPTMVPINTPKPTDTVKENSSDQSKSLKDNHAKEDQNQDVEGISVTSAPEQRNNSSNHASSRFQQFFHSFFHNLSKGNGNNKGNSSWKKSNH